MGTRHPPRDCVDLSRTADILTLAMNEARVFQSIFWAGFRSKLKRYSSKCRVTWFSLLQISASVCTFL